MPEKDCEELIAQLHTEALDQIELALMAHADEVIGMHLDLAAFSKRQAQVAEEIC